MNLGPSERGAELLRLFEHFLTEQIYPKEMINGGHPVCDGQRWLEPTALGELKSAARQQGLWNLYLPSTDGLSMTDYAWLAEATGRSPELGPAAINGAAPDSVNMVMLEDVATDAQREMWLRPLVEDETRSAFAMTEPDVASSDANNIATTIRREGDEYVINGRKWYISGVLNPRCSLLFVMGVSNADAPEHQRHSIVGVPMSTEGVSLVRGLPTFGYDGNQGELTFENVHVPVGNLLGIEGRGFQVAQTRLAAARLHHSMRLVGLAERALGLAVHRAQGRRVAGGLLGEKDVFRSQIADCRLQIDQARLLTLHAAAVVDAHGSRAAQREISAAKIVTTRMAAAVLDRCISAHGALGVSGDVPLARWWANARSLQIADGPEEVHLEILARRELRAASAA